VPVTAIVDYTAVAAAIRADFESRSGQVMTANEVLTIAEKGTGLEIACGSGTVGCDLLINCAGLHSSRIARLAGAEPSVEIIPFRGEYYVLQGPGRDLVRTLIYPVPDPELPFLGLHFTPHLDGSIEAGPSAVLAFAPEGYQRRDVNFGFLLKLAGTPSFRRMARSHWRVGAGELARSFSKYRFAHALRALAPEVTASYLGAGGSGVRAQAVDRHGKLVDDFVLERSSRAIHVLNAPSPAATACLAIGEHIADVVFPV
jgi:L-2-hydroxyglutarate oxidase LhgO